LANGTSLTWASFSFLTDLASGFSHRSGQFLEPHHQAFVFSARPLPFGADLWMGSEG
jgi:hypothetical protein